MDGLDETQLGYMKEECILVDKQDSPIGKASKSDCHHWPTIAEGGGLHRAFSVFLFNSNSEMLLQKRAEAKITFPSVWTNTCCSHPLYNDTEMDTSDNAIGVRRAAKRKLIHELGFTTDQFSIDDLIYLTRIYYKAPSNDNWGEHEIDYCLILRSDATPNPNPNEVQEIRYVSPDQLKHMFRSAETDVTIQFSPWFKMIAEKFLFNWWEKLNALESLQEHERIYSF